MYPLSHVIKTTCYNHKIDIVHKYGQEKVKKVNRHVSTMTSLSKATLPSKVKVLAVDGCGNPGWKVKRARITFERNDHTREISTVRNLTF